MIENKAIDIKGTMIQVAVLVFKEHEIEKDSLNNVIEERVGKHLQLFANIPFIVDFNDVNDLLLYDIARETLSIFNEMEISIIGVRCSDNQWPTLQTLGFSLKLDSKSKDKSLSVQSNEQREDVVAKEDVITPESVFDNKIINHHVRSGQRVYAENKTLIVIGNVSNGAEVIADGNIIVIGSLKGRAMAGAMGSKKAIITAKDMTPEILSIAGVFITSEDIENKYSEVWGSSVTFIMNEDTEEVRFI